MKRLGGLYFAVFPAAARHSEQQEGLFLACTAARKLPARWWLRGIDRVMRFLRRLLQSQEVLAVACSCSVRFLSSR